MQLKLDEFRQGYIVVPLFVEAAYGITNVVRGDMTDSEWNTWRRVSGTRELVRLTNDYRKSGKPIAGMSKAIMNYLTEEGISVCLTNTQRPIC